MHSCIIITKTQMSDLHSHRKLMKSTGFFSDNQTKQDLKDFIYETKEKQLENNEVLEVMLRDLENSKDAHHTHQKNIQLYSTRIRTLETDVLKLRQEVGNLTKSLIYLLKLNGESLPESMRHVLFKNR